MQPEPPSLQPADMKRLILFLLLPALSFGQGRVWQRCGSPVNVPAKFLVNIDIMADTCGGATYKIIGGKWTVNTGLPASMGGEPGPKGDKGDTGPMGPQGPAGGGSMQFPFIVVVGTGDDDVQVRSAIEQNRTTSKPIVLVGNITTGDILINKDNYKLTINGYGAKWNFRSTSTRGLFRQTPINNKEALDYYTTAQFIIEGVEFTGNTNMIALDLGASYMSAYRDLKFNSFKTAIHLRFALRTIIDNCMATNCMNGFLVDIGNWPDASYTSSNSQSNQTTISNSRVQYQIAGGSGNTAIGVYGCSGVVVENCIVEGAKYKRAIEKDFKMCPNDKDFTARNLHLEGIYGNAGSGSGEAYIYIRLVGVAVIDGVYSQYSGCLVDAGGQPGEVTVVVSHVSWTVPDGAKKLFNNAGGVKWIFDANSYQSNITGNPGIFTGTPVSKYAGTSDTQPPNTFIVQ